jgi:hypothetical protein
MGAACRKVAIKRQIIDSTGGAAGNIPTLFAGGTCAATTTRRASFLAITLTLEAFRFKHLLGFEGFFASTLLVVRL